MRPRSLHNVLGDFLSIGVVVFGFLLTAVWVVVLGMTFIKAAAMLL